MGRLAPPDLGEALVLYGLLDAFFFGKGGPIVALAFGILTRRGVLVRR